MALAYIILGLFAGLITSAVIVLLGFGLLPAVAAVSVTGTSASLFGMFRKAACLENAAA